MAGTSLESMRSGVSNSIAQMTWQQRLILGAAFAATIGLIFVVTRLGGDEPMDLLYGGLDSAKAQQITSELASQGVPYELGPGGASIYVPRDRVDQTRLDLAGSGISSGPEGWSLLDNQGFTTSEFDQRTGYQRALQGELASTIESMAAIRSARVTIVMPESDLFSNDDIHAKATVTVELAKAGQLSQSEVQVIVNTVASAVEGLTPDQVTVADTQGVLYAAPGLAAGGGGSNSFDSARQYERQLEGNIRSLLEGVVGPGSARVSVSAELDFSQRVSEVTHHVPVFDAQGNQVVAAETVRNEDYVSPRAELDTGLLGTEDNILDPVDVAENNELYYRLRESDRGYLYDQTVTTRTEAPGTPTGLSVAVVLDTNALAAANLATPESMADLENLVAAAVGLRADRGDLISVRSLPFDATVLAQQQAAADALAASGDGESGLADVIRIGATALVALMVAGFGLMMLKRSHALPRDLYDGNGEPTLTDFAPVGPVLPDIELGPHDSVELSDLSVYNEDDIYELVENQPEDVAHLLRSWLNEPERAK